MKCESCSADISPDSLRCEFCESHVVRPAPVANQPTDTRRLELFERIKSSLQYQEAVAGQGLAQPSAPFLLYAEAGVLLLFCIASLVMTIVVALLGSPMCLIPLVFSIIAGFKLAESGAKLHSYANSPATIVPAIVAAKRATSDSALAEQFATFEYENGDQNEFQIWEQKLFEQITESNPGILIQHGEFVIGFLPCNDVKFAVSAAGREEMKDDDEMRQL